MKLTSAAMARSDSEDLYEVTECATLIKLQNLEVDDTVLDKPNDTTIHSGHFMVSHVHDEPPEDGEESDKHENGSGVDLEVISPRQSPLNGTGHHTAAGCKSASSLVIDGSLRKLFECMTLAHCNKLTSPKWKNFKGVNVRLKDKIRLNNIIWREWHMQFIKGYSAIVCHFETPVSSKSDATLDYWKLRWDSLTKDCKRLTQYFAHRFSAQPDDHELLTRLPSSYYELLERVNQSTTTTKMNNPSLITVPVFSAGDSVIMDDEAINVFFDAFLPPYMSQQQGNSSNVFEEFMDTLEPLPPPLAIDFRGFGRLSSTSGINNSVPTRTTNSSLKLPAPSNLGNRYSVTTTVQQPSQQQLPSVSSQPFSFGSAEDLFALIQSQLASETSLDCLMSGPSIINSSGYSSGATIQSGFTVSDGNLIAAEGASMPLLPSDGSDMQEYPNDESNQICNMFFLPETTSVPVQSMPVFPPVDELPETNFMACDQQSLQLNNSLESSSLQLQNFLQDIATTASQSLLQGSASLPRMKSALHDLEEVGRGSKSLGSLQVNDVNHRGVSNTASSTDSLHKLTASSKFRMPQYAGSRPLPQLQPRPQPGSLTTHSKQSTGILLPMQPIQPTISATNEWSIIMTTGTNQLTVPLVNQYAVGQDLPASNANTAQGNLSTNTKRRVRHKSDQSSSARGTTIRPIAVFQPINPLQTASTSGRTSSKTNCSVSFSLDKNTMISPTPMAEPSSVLQVQGLANSIIFTSLSNSPTIGTMSQVTDVTQNKGVFGENRSCPVIFQTSNQPPGDFSDSVSVNSSSARSRHTSNESNKSTSSHYDDFGGRSLNLKTEPRRQSKELRRVSHITAEQKRRSNIKCGFDTLINLIPELRECPNSRVSKALALHKAAELCKTMKQERVQKQEEVDQLRNEIKALEADIGAYQSQLPATGAPPIKQHVERLNERYEDYFYKRTLDNWKFFLFGSIITQPLLKSFDEEVSRRSISQLRSSLLSWVQTHCSLAMLRPRVTNAMVDLSKQTSILSNPSLVPDEVKDAVIRHRNSQR